MFDPRLKQDTEEPNQEKNLTVLGDNNERGVRSHSPRTVSRVPPPNTLHCDTGLCKNPFLPYPSPAHTTLVQLCCRQPLIDLASHEKKVKSLKDDQNMVSFLEGAICLGKKHH